MVKEIKTRGQWPAVRQALKLQWHIDLYTLRGLLVDAPYAKWLDEFYLNIINTHANELEHQGINRTASGASIGKAFNALGVRSPKMTKSKEAPKECWDKFVLTELIEDPATPPAAIELAQTIKAVRGATKFRAAYVKPMLDGLTRDGRVHCGMRAIGTITGRQSAQRPALQQLPKRSDQRVRAAFMAPEGWVFVSADVSQGEPRMMAANSGDPNLAADLASGDINSALATLAFGRSYNPSEGDVPGTTSFEMRSRTKATFLAKCYGAGIPKMANTLGVSDKEMTIIDQDWNTRYSVLTNYGKQLNQQPHVTLDSGRICPLWDRYFVTEDGQVLLKNDRPSRLAINYKTQGSLADYINNVVIKVIDAGYSWALAMLIHDEVLGCTPEHRAEEFRSVLEQAMVSVYKGVPILCKATINGRTWMPQENTGFDPDEIRELADAE
jgi:DNA polymerase-1